MKAPRLFVALCIACAVVAHPASAEAPAALRASDELCVSSCASDGAQYVCDDAKDQTYENACYARCFGVSQFSAGPCPPPELKNTRRAASYLKSQARAPTDASEKAPLVAPSAKVAASERSAETKTDAGALVVPGSRQSAQTLDRAALRIPKSNGTDGGVALRPAAAAPAAAPAFTKLYVTRRCAEVGDLWFAASYVPYGSTTFKTEGWWRISRDGQSVYFANTRNRYFYLYAYAQQCANGRCCNRLFWSGSTTLRLGSTSYGFVKYDFGTTILDSYTVNLRCSCITSFCLTAPCCNCR